MSALAQKQTAKHIKTDYQSAPEHSSDIEPAATLATEASLREIDAALLRHGFRSDFNTRWLSQKALQVILWSQA